MDDYSSDPYMYSFVTLKYGDQEKAYLLPEEDGNFMMISIMDHITEYLHSNKLLFRSTKDKVCWKEQGKDCVVEFS